MPHSDPALRRSESLLERTGRIAGIGGWEYDIARREILRSNEIYRIFGADPDVPLKAEELLQFYVPESRAVIRAALDLALADGSGWDLELAAIRADGRHIWVRSVGEVEIENGKHVRFAGAIQNITERKLREDALGRSEAFLDRTSRIAGVGGWEFDITTGKTLWSDEICHIYGVEPGYSPTIDETLDFFLPEVRPAIREVMEGIITEAKGFDLELPLMTGYGHVIWIRILGTVECEGGKPIKVIGASQDITERKQREEALRRSEAFLDRTGRIAGIGGYELDIVTGELMWSDETCRLHGVEPGYKPTPHDVGNFFPAEQLPIIRAAMGKAIAEGIGHDLELQLNRRDGSTIWVRTIGSVECEQGKPVRLTGALQDITERLSAQRALQRAAAELAEQHELLRVTLHSIGDAVITTDAEGKILWLNPAAEHLTGWSASEAIGLPLGQVVNIVNEKLRLTTQELITAYSGKGEGLATVLISRDGEKFGIENSAAPIRNERGDMLGTVLVFHDVTEQRRMSGEMTYRATHDVLTGLVNRTEFEVRLRRLLNSTHENGKCHALLYIDLDQFKLVNDACGHTVGDQLLQQVAKLLKEAIRSRDVVSRLGGDEFGIVLDHCTAERAARVGQQICDLMEDFRFSHDGRRFRIGASIGLVPIDKRWPNTAAILQAADTSCYAAKEGGRNRVHTWLDTDQALRARHGEMQWTTRIEQALDEDRFVLFGQRIVPLLGASEGLHAEVLLRMLNDDGSFIMPGSFLPAAERFHLAGRIDRWVLKHVIDWIGSVPSLSIIERLSVNVSGQSIGDRTFHRLAVDLLLQAGRETCERLCFEITETAAVTNMADAKLFIEDLRRLGVKIALDDFGAGASSFGYLKTLPVDFLKIDGQFIRDVIDDPLEEAAVRSFVDVAKVVGVKTVAEFVDKPQILQRLREMNVDFAQGFYVHRPEPLAQMKLPVEEAVY